MDMYINFICLTLQEREREKERAELSSAATTVVSRHLALYVSYADRNKSRHRLSFSRHDVNDNRPNDRKISF